MIIPLHTFGLGGNTAPLAGGLSASSATASQIGNGPFTTNSVTITASGGTQPYTYAWSKVSGDTLTISSATSATVNWTASGTAPQTLSAVWNCVITDAAGRTVTSSNVSVSIAFNVSTLTAGLSASSVSASQTGDGTLATGSVVATPSGGTSPYTYAWTYVSGDSSIAVNDSGAQSVTFSRTGTAGNCYSSVWQCVVTDADSSTANAGTVTITLTFNTPALSVSLSGTSVTATLTGSGTATTTPTITATPSGGTAPYTYNWQYISGDLSVYPTNPTSSSTDFAQFGSPEFTYISNYRCVVTDSASNTVNSATVGITIDFVY